MYFFYADESGTLDPTTEGKRSDGTKFSKDHLYVLAAVSLYEGRWNQFDKAINSKKRELLDVLKRSPASTPQLDLLDCEVKSTWLRIPKQRDSRSPFLASLTDQDRTALANLYYSQLGKHYMRLFAVVIDKRYLHDYIDAPKLHRKAWELLLELIEKFLSLEHPKHHGVMVADDLSKQQNRSLAAKHQYFQMAGTSVGWRLRHIVELPLFVPSELSNGVQLADLFAYNVYRCFRDENLSYSYFERCLPHIWAPKQTAIGPIEGLRVFPPKSPLCSLVDDIARKKAGQPE